MFERGDILIAKKDFNILNPLSIMVIKVGDKFKIIMVTTSTFMAHRLGEKLSMYNMIYIDYSDKEFLESFISIANQRDELINKIIE
jgi:hypothetical protein